MTEKVRVIKTQAPASAVVDNEFGHTEVDFSGWYELVGVRGYKQLRGQVLAAFGPAVGEGLMRQFNRYFDERKEILVQEAKQQREAAEAKVKQ